ncbi:hypothetical protein UPYG_G00217630 [Umbra pygmaea]|uniref:Uncharacterized protein n=1 Tax=Umbra pygmaea TaxID=75934 RepID=A0ABD0X793_UMBPY
MGAILFIWILALFKTCGADGCLNVKTASSTSTCFAINECQNQFVCRRGRCINTTGNFYCDCHPGYKSLATEFCRDIDECLNKTACLNRKCINTPGGYYCTQRNGKELSCDQFEKQPGQTLPGFDNLLTLMKDNCLMLRNSSSTGPKGETLTGERLLEVLVNATDEIQLALLNKSHRGGSDVTNFLQTIEVSIRLIAPQLKENFTRMVTNYTEAEILVNRDRTQPKGPVSLINEKAQLDTTWETVAGDEQNYPGSAFVILLSFKTLNMLNVSSSLQSQQLMSDVITVSISNPNSENLLQPVQLTFSHLQSSDMEPDCVYWSEEDGLGVWSGQGCTRVMSNSTHTICSCDHLSSFTVIEGIQSNGLSTVMWVCLLVALACVILSLITTMWCRSVSLHQLQQPGKCMYL